MRMTFLDITGNEAGMKKSSSIKCLQPTHFHPASTYAHPLSIHGMKLQMR